MNKSQRNKLFNDFILPHLRKNRYITRKELRDIFGLQDNDLLIIVNEGRMKRIKQGIYTLPENNDIIDILKHKRVQNPRAEETADYLESYASREPAFDDWENLLEDIYMDC